MHVQILILVLEYICIVLTSSLVNTTINILTSSVCWVWCSTSRSFTTSGSRGQIYVVVARPDFNVYTVQLSYGSGQSKNVTRRELQLINTGPVTDVEETNSASDDESRWSLSSQKPHIMTSLAMMIGVKISSRTCQGGPRDQPRGNILTTSICQSPFCPTLQLRPWWPC